jgi:hypothetical protein
MRNENNSRNSFVKGATTAKAKALDESRAFMFEMEGD